MTLSGELDALLKDKKALTAVLTYHVASGKVMAADVVKLTQVNTLAGSPVKIRVKSASTGMNDVTGDL